VRRTVRGRLSPDRSLGVSAKCGQASWSEGIADDMNDAAWILSAPTCSPHGARLERPRGQEPSTLGIPSHRRSQSCNGFNSPPYDDLMLIPSLLCLLLAPQADEAQTTLGPHPLDRVIQLELTANESLHYEYVSEFEGTLHVWTTSKFDLALRIEELGENKLLAEDDYSGGEGTPYIRLEVEVGDGLAIQIAQGQGDDPASGALTLHLIVAPETGATRAGALRGHEVEAAAEKLIEEGDGEGARKIASPAMLALGELEGGDYSEAIAEAAWGLGFPCVHSGDLLACLAGWSAGHRHRDRTLPPSHPALLAARGNLANAKFLLGDL